MRRLACVLMGLILALNVPSPAWAGGVDYTVEVSQKFGRGIKNIFSSPLELPCVMADEVNDRGALGLVTGLFLGPVFFVRRLLVGVTEVGTFVIPMEATLAPVCSKGPEPVVQTSP